VTQTFLSDGPPAHPPSALPARFTLAADVAGSVRELSGKWGEPCPPRTRERVTIVASRDEDALGRIRSGLLYTETEASFRNSQRRSDLIFEYNQTRPSDTTRRRSLLETILGSVGERTVILAPFHAGFGSNVHIGDDFFGNVNLTFVDDVEIRIGNGVMIAPCVTLTTTGHPIHPDLRVDFRRFSEPIVIEDKVWIGSNAVVLPGVRVGFGAVIGAGSVVTHDIPAMTVSVGVPCRVLRHITDDDLHTRTASAE
jgi:galactoside O-acetyltransferase